MQEPKAEGRRLCRAAVQPCSHAAMQPCSHAAVQPCSHEAGPILVDLMIRLDAAITDLTELSHAVGCTPCCNTLPGHPEGIQFSPLPGLDNLWKPTGAVVARTTRGLSHRPGSPDGTLIFIAASCFPPIGVTCDRARS
jgi:hypothetical protein